VIPAEGSAAQACFQVIDFPFALATGKSDLFRFGVVEQRRNFSANNIRAL
jgi:hypothetical protein